MTSSTCFLRSCDRSSCVCKRATSKFRSDRAENSPNTLSERDMGAGGAGGAGSSITSASGAASSGAAAAGGAMESK